MHSSSSRCELVPVGLGPLEALSTLSAPRPSSTRSRRSRGVLYPPSHRRRPLRREPSDPACRWLLLFSLLVFLQICSEETHTCAELQDQCTSPETCCPQEGDGSLGEANRCSDKDSWRPWAVDRTTEHQLQCVVA
ncbi:hypothetical protein CHARACLAT_031936 [Characodon lateralis]|uniref:Uncharacterized protein n=1 Tax=Characodon lateralis TaxID=208331 RepID=A0ABU7EPL7_9TELE|nr:hypothetical protein [Characodon lateralis]